MWVKTIGLDNHNYDSKQEAALADYLFINGIRYEPHKRVPGCRQICDFYLTDYDVYVEWDGVREVRSDGKLKRKIKFYEDHQINYIVLRREDWEWKLFEIIVKG